MGSVMLLTACSPSASGSTEALHFAGTPGQTWTIGIGLVPKDGPASIGSIPLCVEPPAKSITITSVEAIDTFGSPEVTSFRLHPMTPGTSLGSFHGTLEQAQFEGTKSAVTPCGSKTPPADELGIEMTRHTEGTSKIGSFRVKYSDGAHAGTVDLPFTVVLCGPDDTTQDCRQG